MKLADPAWIAAKAGVASSLAVLATRALGVDDALSAGFVALACVSPSAYAGVKNGLLQLAGTALACAVAGAPIALHPAWTGSPVALLVALVLSIYACFALRLASAYLVAGFSVLYLHLLPFSSAASGISVRIEAVAVGLVAATIVNSLVSGLFGERVARRRVHVTRAIVAADLEHAAAWVRGPRVTEPPELEDAFAVVRELRADLGAAAHERLFPGARRARASASRGLCLASALERLAHVAKEITSLAAIDDASRSAAARALSSAARALGGDECPVVAGPIDALSPPLAAAVARLGDSLREARETALVDGDGAPLARRSPSKVSRS